MSDETNLIQSPPKSQDILTYKINIFDEYEWRHDSELPPEISELNFCRMWHQLAGAVRLCVSKQPRSPGLHRFEIIYCSTRPLSARAQRVLDAARAFMPEEDILRFELRTDGSRGIS